MKKIVVLLLFLIAFIQNMHAHNPLSAMYYLEVNNDIGILNISLSQNGLHEALKKHYSEIVFKDLSSVEYKQLAVNYLKENFYLDVNGKTIALSEGGMKLGNHQTDAKFIIKDLPKIFKNLNVKIKAFKENENHQTIFSLLLNGKTSKLILKQKNDYTSTVTFMEDLMVTSDATFNKNYLWCLVIIPVFMFSKRLATKTN